MRQRLRKKYSLQIVTERRKTQMPWLLEDWAADLLRFADDLRAIDMAVGRGPGETMVRSRSGSAIDCSCCFIIIFKKKIRNPT